MDDPPSFWEREVKLLRYNKPLHLSKQMYEKLEASPEFKAQTDMKFEVEEYMKGFIRIRGIRRD